MERRLARGPVAILCLLVAAGCAGAYDGTGETADPAPNLTVLSSRQHDYDSWLQLNLKLNTETLFLGETLVMDLTIRNLEPEPHVIGVPNGCRFGWSLWDATGRRVAQPPVFCTMAPERIRFGPSSTSPRRFEWTWDDPDLPAGAYTLTVGVGSDGRLPAAEPVLIWLQ